MNFNDKKKNNAIWFWRELSLLRGFISLFLPSKTVSRRDYHQLHLHWEPGRIEGKTTFRHILTGCLLFVLQCDWFTFSKFTTLPSTFVEYIPGCKYYLRQNSLRSDDAVLYSNCREQSRCFLL